MKRALEFAGVLSFVLLISVFPSCNTMDSLSDMGADIAVASGAVTPQQGESIKRAGSALVKTFESFTPEQEYYIGRTVGAVIVSRYRPLDNEAANRYLNVLGGSLAQFSDMPQTFGGYRFLLLESEEINAFAAPGGFIFVSKGMLRCCGSEDALAAVIAHEIAHVTLRHGLQAIRKSRITSALSIIGAESAKSLGGRDLAELTEVFEGTVSDITATLMNNGYSRVFERQADRAAVDILKRAGYNPRALADMLGEMKKRLKPGGPDFARTHPSPDSRIREIDSWIGRAASAVPNPVRSKRFQAAIGQLIQGKNG